MLKVVRVYCNLCVWLQWIFDCVFRVFRSCSFSALTTWFFSVSLHWLQQHLCQTKIVWEVYITIAWSSDFVQADMFVQQYESWIKVNKNLLNSWLIACILIRCILVFNSLYLNNLSIINHLVGMSYGLVAIKCRD